MADHTGVRLVDAKRAVDLYRCLGLEVIASNPVCRKITGKRSKAAKQFIIGLG